MTNNETLLTLMSLPPSQFSGVCRTADGFYIGRAVGDLGYNHFLGRPARVHDGPGRTQMLVTWTKLTADERRAVIRLAANPPDGQPILLLEDFGIPIEDDDEPESREFVAPRAKAKKGGRGR